MKQLDARLIYGLIACVLLINAPHFIHLPLWVSALNIALLCWRGYLAWANRPMPPRWLLPALVTAAMGGILLTFHTLFGREAGVTMLVLLAAFKLLELRAARDAFVVLYLACFIIITNFLYSQTMPTALFMLITLLVILTTWIHLQAATLALPIRLTTASVLLLQAIPLTLILFVLFPRMQGPLWGMPPDAYATTGLDDKMSPGSVSRLSKSDAVAFRASFEGAPPQQKQMYWRGPVLWDFDGLTWTKGKASRPKQLQLDQLAAPFDYTVTLEPHNKTWLFALDMPTQLSIPAQMTYDFQMLQAAPVTQRLRYTAHSQLTYRANAEESVIQLLRALVIPRNLNPRAQQLAAEWREKGGGAEAVVRAALDYFNREGFGYTLNPPLLGRDGIDDFLFGTRKGFCEHYAGSFVYLMRAAGIPARVVTGYQGGEYNAPGNYYVVRQSDAHAWAEVWLQGRGWVRVDPTAAIAPERVEKGMSAALSPADSAELPLLMRTQSPWLQGFYARLDAATNEWNQWVLGYNPQRQIGFLTRMGMEDISWQKMAFTMLGGVALLFGLYTLTMLRTLRAKKTDAVQQLYLKFCRRLAKRGIERNTFEGPQDFAARAALAMPEHAPAVMDITARYVALRYGQEENSDALSSLRRAVGAFKL
jgi:transglutaminase-like putative cysteine protease